MRIAQLHQQYITESWNDPEMLLLEQKVIQPWVADLERMVAEATLTPDQINNLFTSIEQGATDAGGNRTAVGKGTDAVGKFASAINKKIDDLGSAIQKAGPVQNMDAKFNELKQKIGDKDSKVVQGVKAVSDWAKENPGKATVAVAILTSAAALAGGPLGGAVAGFLARATKDILQGKELSTAVGKSIKTGAVGALAGGAIQAVGDLIDPDISQAIIASDGQTIDVNGLEAMSATSLEDVSPEAIEDLLKTQNALETALKNVSGEEAEIIQAEFAETSKKIGELGGRDALADYAGLEGQDLARDTTTSTSVDSTDPDGPGGAEGTLDVKTVDAETVTADRLKEAGINFDTEPNISPEVKAWAESKGLDPDDVQKIFQMEKGLSDAKFMGTEISANKSLATSWTGEQPTLTTTTLPDGNEIKVGDMFKSEITSTVGDIDPPLTFSSTVSVEGVDADGKPVMMIKEVFTNPTHPLWDNIDKANLSDDDFKQLMDFMDEYSGVAADSKADVATLVDTLKQDIAKSIGAAATAVAMGTAMQDKTVVGEGAVAKEESKISKGQKLSEGQVYLLFNRLENVNTHMLENKLMFESAFDAVRHYNKQELEENPLGALAGAAAKVGAAAKGVGGAVARGAKAAGAKAAQGAKIAGAAIGKGARKAGAGIAGAAKQVTTKVTAEKLMTAWKKAGSPTDSDEVYNVIKGLGVNDDVIKGTYDSMKIKTPATAAAPAQAQEPAAGEEPAAPVDANNDGKDDATGEPMPAASDPLAKEKPADGEQPAAGGEQPATPAKPIDLKTLAGEISKLQQPVKDKIKQQLVAAS